MPGYGSDKMKASLYFTEADLAFLRKEAQRQDRPLSWLVRQALRIARPTIEKLPGRFEGVSG